MTPGLASFLVRELSGMGVGVDQIDTIQLCLGTCRQGMLFTFGVMLNIPQGVGGFGHKQARMGQAVSSK